MATLRDFERELNRFQKDVEDEVSQAAKLLATKVFTGVVAKTPVDKGRARASWTLAMNQADRRVVDEPQAGTDASSRGAAAQQQAMTQHKNLPAKVTLREQIVISNNVPYILALEEGHSRQSPPGNMVAATVQEVQAEFDTLVATLKTARR